MTESDGSIYVAGYIYNGFNYFDWRHCFVLRLDHELNKINARSLGAKEKNY